MGNGNWPRIGFVSARRRLDDEARRELEAHLELLTDRYVRSGMTPGAARAAARRQLGNVTLVREEVFRMNGIGWADRLAQDLRYAVRQLRHNPIVTAVVVGTLGLGIGDPRILLATSTVLAITGLVSAWLPARRASRVDPIAAVQQG